MFTVDICNDFLSKSEVFPGVTINCNVLYSTFERIWYLQICHTRLDYSVIKLFQSMILFMGPLGSVSVSLSKRVNQTRGTVGIIKRHKRKDKPVESVKVEKTSRLGGIQSGKGVMSIMK